MSNGNVFVYTNKENNAERAVTNPNTTSGLVRTPADVVSNNSISEAIEKNNGDNSQKFNGGTGKNSMNKWGRYEIDSFGDKWGRYEIDSFI